MTDPLDILRLLAVWAVVSVLVGPILGEWIRRRAP